MVLIPRVRMIAGPNGSGKTTIKEIIHPQWLGIYINADEIEKEIRTTGSLDLSQFAVTASQEQWSSFVEDSSLFSKFNLVQEALRLKLNGDEVRFRGIEPNSYHAAGLADFIRQDLLSQRVSFSFETVMSSPDKVQFLKKAHEAGYRTYLYYVATEDPQINVDRVQQRVEAGGHDVPEDKIREQYARSLGLLPEALKWSNRAYIFDNSGRGHSWIAEVTDGERIEIKSDHIPGWFTVGNPHP